MLGTDSENKPFDSENNSDSISIVKLIIIKNRWFSAIFAPTVCQQKFGILDHGSHFQLPLPFSLFSPQKGY